MARFGDRMQALLLAGALALNGTALAGPVSFATQDGVTIRGTEYGKGAKGVVLVHGEGQSSTDWAYFAEKLARSGFHVVAIDLRGHGASVRPEPLEEADYAAMVTDVDAAMAWLGTRGATSFGLVGSDLGANLSLHAASKEARVASLVLLSPGLNLHGLTVSAPLAAYGERPVLVAASEEDAYSAKSARYVETKALGPVELEILENAGSGTTMLNRSIDLEDKVIAWLGGDYGRAKGQAGAGRDLSTGETSDLETTGVRFGDEKQPPPPTP